MGLSRFDGRKEEMPNDKNELRSGDLIEIENGGSASIIRELGRGGQGIVYLAKYNGKEYALKWYFYNKLEHPELFRQNLSQNIIDGSPEESEKFIWPSFLTKNQNGNIWISDESCPIWICRNG